MRMANLKFFIVMIILCAAPKLVQAADAGSDWQRVVGAAKKEGKVVIGAPRNNRRGVWMLIPKG